MSKPVFSRARRDLVVALLTAAGTAGALTACSSNEATYRPAPQGHTHSPGHSCGHTHPHTQPGPAQPYVQPTQPYTQPAQPTAPRPGGQMSCGKGKCG